MAKTNVFGIMRDLEAEKLAYQKRSEAIREACHGLRNSELGRVCARYELESDEFMTAEDKALHVIQGGTIPARY